MDEWRNEGGSGLFTFNVVSEPLNKSFFEIQLHHHMYSKDGSPGIFHRSTRYLLLKYVYLLCLCIHLVTPNVERLVESNVEKLNVWHDRVWIF